MLALPVTGGVVNPQSSVVNNTGGSTGSGTTQFGSTVFLAPNVGASLDRTFGGSTFLQHPLLGVGSTRATYSS